MRLKDTLSRRQIYLALCLLGLVAYHPVLKLGFLWDDHVLIEANSYIRQWTVENLKHDLGSTVSNGVGDEGFMRPVVTWSNRLDYSFWSLNPFGYHLTSLLLHIANALLLYELILLLGFTSMTALLTSVLFVVHPIGVEGLICVTGRATFLSFFFGLLTLLLMAKPSWPAVLAGLVTFMLALGSKEVSVILPGLMFLVWVVRKAPKKHYLLLIPMGGVLLSYLLFRTYVFGAAAPLSTPSFMARFFSQAFPRILNHYVALLLVPWNLHSHRMIMRMSHLWPVALGLWIFLLGWSTRNRKKMPWLFLSVNWLVLTLLPPSAAMFTGGFILDHWGYWMAPAVLLPIGILFDRLWTKRRIASAQWRAMLFFPLLLSYALLTHLNIELRGTDEKMFRWALRFTESHPINYNLGILLLKSGRALEAIPYLEDVRAAYPEDLNNLHALALAYWETGHPKVALKILKMLVQYHPTFQPAIQSLKTATASISKR